MPRRGRQAGRLPYNWSRAGGSQASRNRQAIGSEPSTTLGSTSLTAGRSGQRRYTGQREEEPVRALPPRHSEAAFATGKRRGRVPLLFSFGESERDNRGTSFAQRVKIAKQSQFSKVLEIVDHVAKQYVKKNGAPFWHLASFVKNWLRAGLDRAKTDAGPLAGH